MTLDDLLSRMGSRELSLWLAKDRIDPPQDGYWQAALIASTLANCFGNGKRRYTIADFLPRRPDDDDDDEEHDGDDAANIAEIKAFMARAIRLAPRPM